MSSRTQQIVHLINDRERSLSLSLCLECAQPYHYAKALTRLHNQRSSIVPRLNLALSRWCTFYNCIYYTIIVYITNTMTHNGAAATTRTQSVRSLAGWQPRYVA